MNQDHFGKLREQMLLDIVAHMHLAGGQIGKPALDARVMEAMAKVPRHEFVPAELQFFAYSDTPLPIGYEKTISQPFIVALMTDLLQLEKTHSVLEIGTGLGYQAAVLGELADKVYSIEFIEELAAKAAYRLNRLGYLHIQTTIGDGYRGWAEHAPFDRIIVTASPQLIPPPLLMQLKRGGRMVIPTGLPESQKLVLACKAADGSISTEEILPVRFSELEGDEAAKPC
ncbi:MAG: protein-L-isoaspartate(D-aspartate) O-methyltransferase [Gammaproteobacteria bacterium]